MLAAGSWQAVCRLSVTGFDCRMVLVFSKQRDLIIQLHFSYISSSEILLVNVPKVGLYPKVRASSG
jgi:hypothetical protein